MTTMDVARADLAAHTNSVRLPIHEVIAELREILGAKLTAYIGSVSETRAVRQWANAERAPSASVAERLRTAYQVAAILSTNDSPAVVQAWFQGMNPQLDDVAPARLLREGTLDHAGPSVLAAARAFAAAAG